MTALLARLPVRWKVTAAFTLALFGVLTATGAFLYLRLASELHESTDRTLATRAAQVVALVARSGVPDSAVTTEEPATAGAGTTLESDENLTQVLDADGRVLASTIPTRLALAGPAQRRDALNGPAYADRPGDRELDENLRLLAVPATGPDGVRRLVVVGTSTDETAEALSSLLLLELIGFGGALLVAAAAGYLVAGVALWPVEAMRRRAEQIGDDGVAGIRLPVPTVDDELGRLGRTMNAMLDRLELSGAAERRAIDKERRFVADASHELRTPLTIIKSEVDVALLNGSDPTQLRAALTSTGEETDRLVRLTDGLLLLARLDEGRPPEAPPVTLATSVRRVLARYRPDGDAPAMMVVQVPEDLRVSVDPVALEQVLGNLVENAVRHGSGRVVISAAAQEHEVRVSVRDHGPGFPDDFAGRAVERFSRADTGRGGEGTGLGLAIVDAVVRAHGGTVTVGNAAGPDAGPDAGPGAEVSFTLPR